MNAMRLRLFVWASSLILACLLNAPGSDKAGAQELPWLHGGQAAFDFAPSYWTWTSRYGLAPDGSSQVQPLGASLTSSALGTAIIPSLSPLQSDLQDALGDPGYSLSLGASRAFIDQSRLTFPFRLDVGVTDWLTLGAMVPLVRPRMEITFALDADFRSADLGVSPQLTNASQVSQFLNQFQAVIDGAQELHAGDPSLVAAQAYLTALANAYDETTFFPVAESSTGRRLQRRLDSIGAALGAIDVTGVPTTLPMPSDYVTEADFNDFVTSTSHGLAAYPLEDWTTPWSVGDVELTAALRLLSGGFEPDSLGNLPAFRYRLGTGLLVRLGTGQQADPNRFLEQDPADGQNDFEGNVFGLLQLGSRFGGWGRFRYGIQTQGQVIRRIAPPSETLPGPMSLAQLNWTPGNYTDLDVNPRFYLNSAMSFGVRYHRWSKEADSYELPGSGSIVLEGTPSPSVLDQETEENLRELGITATFSTLDAFDRGAASIPVYIRATYFTPIGGSGGRTPKGGRFQAGVTIYRTIWGGAPHVEKEANGPGR